MRTRFAVSLANVVLYVFLINRGNQETEKRYAYVEEAANHGISIDLEWRTPWPTGLAHGLNLPVVLATYTVASMTGLAPPNVGLSSPEPQQLEMLIAFLTGIFWFLVIAYWQRSSSRTTMEADRRKMRKRMLALAGFIFACACIWGVYQNFDVSLSYRWGALKEDFELGNTLAQMFGLVWVAIGTLLLMGMLKKGKS
jgi:hypothetical protein